jgi:hypothetical protein
MGNSDNRYKLRIEHIQAQKSASKLMRALLQLQKIIFREFFVRQRPSRGFDQDVEHLVLSVAFNNPELIELQAQALKRFVSEKHSFVVIDNSSDEEQSIRLEALGDAYGFSYVKAPRNPFSWVDPSVSHSLALDWAWQRVVRKVKPVAVLFLDHDVFPIDTVSLQKFLGRFSAVGYKRQSVGSDSWLLWPGLLMLRFSVASHHKISFMPRRDTDSGGSLQWTLYSKLRNEDLGFLPREDVVFDRNSPKYGDGSGGEFHIFDDRWLHLVDGSGWSDGVGKLSKLPSGGAEQSLDSLITAVAELRRSANPA